MNFIQIDVIVKHSIYENIKPEYQKKKKISYYTNSCLYIN